MTRHDQLEGLNGVASVIVEGAQSSRSSAPLIADVMPVTVLKAEPGQIFALMSPVPLSQIATERIRAEWRHVWESAGLCPPPVIVLEDGMTIQVAQAPEDEEVRQ